MAVRKLVINKCPTHGYWSVSIDDEHGGTRVTRSKCCGRWDTVKEFTLSQSDWQELAMLAEQAAEDVGD